MAGLSKQYRHAQEHHYRQRACKQTFFPEGKSIVDTRLLRAASGSAGLVLAKKKTHHRLLTRRNCRLALLRCNCQLIDIGINFNIKHKINVKYRKVMEKSTKSLELNILYANIDCRFKQLLCRSAITVNDLFDILSFSTRIWFRRQIYSTYNCRGYVCDETETDVSNRWRDPPTCRAWMSNSRTPRTLWPSSGASPSFNRCATSYSRTRSCWTPSCNRSARRTRRCCSSSPKTRSRSSGCWTSRPPERPRPASRPTPPRVSVKR